MSTANWTGRYQRLLPNVCSLFFIFLFTVRPDLNSDTNLTCWVQGYQVIITIFNTRWYLYKFNSFHSKFPILQISLIVSEFFYFFFKEWAFFKKIKKRYFLTSIIYALVSSCKKRLHWDLPKVLMRGPFPLSQENGLCRRPWLSLPTILITNHHMII